MSARIEAIRERRKTRELMASIRQNPWCGGPYIIHEPQKTLRDEFAAKAMPQAIAALDNPSAFPEDAPFDWDTVEDGGPSSDMNLAAKYAYAMADAMLAARASTKGAA